MPVLAPLLLLDIDGDELLRDVLESGGRILFVFLLAYIAIRVIEHLIAPLLRVAIREQMSGQGEPEVRKRIETLTSVVNHTLVVAIGIIALVTIMPEFGVNPGPLIAGLGLIGLAVGFGAQSLVRDIINGLELLIENQYGRGDFIRLRSTTGGMISGVVEDLNLRRTVLRDNDGTVHFISHGSVEVASNMTRIYSRVYLHLAIASSIEHEKALSIINQTGEELIKDPRFAAVIREAPRATSLDRVGEDRLEVRVVGETEPGEQWKVAAELRLRLVRAFEAEGTRIYEISTV